MQDLENEIWVDIPNYEGIHMISNLGRVKSLPKKYVVCGRKRGNSIKTIIGRGGYYYVALRNDVGEQKNFLLHRIIAISFIPNELNKPLVNHINGKRTDNRIENLEWNTYSENNKHAYVKGKQIRKFGENSPQAKLNWDKVNEIRSKYKYWEYTSLMLANEYGVSKGCIVAVITNKSWNNEHNK